MSHALLPRSAHRRSRGVTLIEALVALVVMAFGMVALAGLQGHVRRSADLAKQRSEATRFAQENMEAARAFSVLTPPEIPASGVRAYSDIVSGNASHDAGNVSYALTRTVVDSADFGTKLVRVMVSWQDRTGDDQQVWFESMIAPLDPSLAAFLSLAPDGNPNRRPAGRSAKIPTTAKDLGGGISAFKPPGGGSMVWIFDNRSGNITGLCSSSLALNDITAADVSTCRGNAFGYLLSGYVRFSEQDPPNPAQPVGQARPLGLALTLTSTGHSLEPSYQCFDDAPAEPTLTQTSVAYYCVVYPNQDKTPIWSGRLELSELKLAADGQRVCRYSGDYDGDGKIGNGEHPASYSKVSESLVRQNFLVIPFANSCPAGQKADPAQGRYTNTQTQAHQP